MIHISAKGDGPGALAPVNSVHARRQSLPVPHRANRWAPGIAALGSPLPAAQGQPRPKATRNRAAAYESGQPGAPCLHASAVADCTHLSDRGANCNGRSTPCTGCCRTLPSRPTSWRATTDTGSMVVDVGAAQIADLTRRSTRSPRWWRPRSLSREQELSPISR
jgi:hypothetical protein